jgi:hypothetical protein
LPLERDSLPATFTELETGPYSEDQKVLAPNDWW